MTRPRTLRTVSAGFGFGARGAVVRAAGLRVVGLAAGFATGFAVAGFAAGFAVAGFAAADFDAADFAAVDFAAVRDRFVDDLAAPARLETGVLGTEAESGAESTGQPYQDHR